jgi:hypothetical protein
MKNYRLLIVVLAFLFASPTESFADGICRTRNSCNFWNSQHRYEARSRVTNNFINFNQNKAWSCAPNSVYAFIANNCAWQESHNYYGAHYYGGAVVSNYSSCSRGGLKSDLYSAIFSSNFAPDETFSEKSEIRTGVVKFNSNHSIMDSINGYVSANGENVFSSFEVIMWIPQNEEDSIPTSESTFQRGKITLMNGVVITDGCFSGLNLVPTIDASGNAVLNLRNLSVTGYFPDGVTSTSTGIEVMSISDGGVDENHALRQLVNEDIAKVVLFPNPTADYLSIDLKDLEESTLKISIYDNDGNFIVDVIESLATKDLDVYTFSLLNKLPNSGTYYLLLSSQNQTILKRFKYNK